MEIRDQWKKQQYAEETEKLKVKNINLNKVY